MSQSVRQSELFTAQSWDVLYRAFTQINFNASDPPSINKALREYIQTNYAEDFSDWIASSEFIAIIDLLSWLAGTLAYKTDINGRENFLESAQARESILRLARFLSYNPRRNQAARGLLKLREIQTDDDVVDALGNSLANRTITWADPDNPDWFDQFVLVLNAAFVSTNPFGVPLKATSLAGLRAQQYRLNARFGEQALGFDATVSGVSMPFEIINSDVDDVSGFFERTPNFDAAMHMLYLADGRGNASARTGFFIGFKQGQLQRSIVQIRTPVENQLIDVTVDNINQSDVWVQTVNDQGGVITDWTGVPSLPSDNVTFNALPATKRNIYSVVTRDRDQISLRFSDGRFGAAPVGSLRVWYRVSNGLQYQIRPSELTDIRISLAYYNRVGVRHTLTLTFGLEEAVSNSAPRETEEQIRRRAPQVYATQSRMVSGEDYNTLPLSSNLATKIKAVTRTYSGQSRFVDLNDPTGNYRDVTVFGDDGLFYLEPASQFAEVPLTDNRTSAEMIDLFVQPMLRDTTAVNYLLDYYVKLVRAGSVRVPDGLRWTRSTLALYSSTGAFNLTANVLRPGATLLFAEPGSTARNKWVTIADVRGTQTTVVSGVAGPVVLAEPVATGSPVLGILPRYASTLTETFFEVLAARIDSRVSFSLWYDWDVADPADHWSIRPASSLRTNAVSGSAVRMLNAEYLSGTLWRFSVPGARYVFESQGKVQFYHGGQNGIDATNGQTAPDLIRILRVNDDLLGGVTLERDYNLSVDHMIHDPDGYQDPTRITVTPRDSDEDGYPDDPDFLYRIASDEPRHSTLFWTRNASGTYRPDASVWVYAREVDRVRALDVPIGTIAYQIDGTAPNSFWRFNTDGWAPREAREHRTALGRGFNVAARWFTAGGVPASKPAPAPIKYQWKHYVPGDRRVDPSKTNLIDLFVLTTEYDYLVRQWIANGAVPADLPVPPSELDLRLTFGSFETFKMFSDDIVWRPARYRCLFGSGSDANVRAKFKVVKLQNANLSDGEIKARVVQAISRYFSASLWDFGETFYYTELAAYVHQQLANVIGSIVIVPETSTGAFGDGFEVRCRLDEIFISTATVNDVTIIDSNTPVNLRIS